MLRIFIVLLLFHFILSQNAGAEASLLPSLKKEQMMEDFDQLIKIVRENSPAEPLNKKVYGLDIIKTLKRYRAAVKGDESPEEFALLLSKAMRACKIHHFVHAVPHMITAAGDDKEYEFYGGFAPELLDINRIYRDYIAHHDSRKMKLNLPLLYYRGDYYLQNDVSIGGKFFEKGLKLLTCNDKAPGEILVHIQDYLTCWDFEKQCFYGNPKNDNFYAYMDLKPGELLAFQFQRADSSLVDIVCEQNDLIQLPTPLPLIKETVEFFPESGILYLRIPAMDNKKQFFFLNSIKKQRNQNIRAVVLDIRGCTDGMETLWKRIISSISSASYEVHSVWAAKKTVLSQADKQWKPGCLPYFETTDWLLRNAEYKISPSKDSLMLKVPIYVLTQDVYSLAGGTLLDFADKVPGVYSVGSVNPRYLEAGSVSAWFSLKNSKFVFRIHKTLDVSNAKSAEDVLYTRMEIKLNMSLKENLDYLNFTDRNIPLEERLCKHDPFFMRVLNELKRSAP